jgi:hypothetical protein
MLRPEVAVLVSGMVARPLTDGLRMIKMTPSEGHFATSQYRYLAGPMLHCGEFLSIGEKLLFVPEV